MSATTRIKCGGCGYGHATVVEVKACCLGIGAVEPEMGFTREIQRREREEEERVARFKMDRDAELLSSGAVRGTSPKYYYAEKKAQPITQDGMYRNPHTGEIFKVQWNRGSGDGKRLYAKQLYIYIDGVAWTEIPTSSEEVSNCKTDFEFRYAPGALKLIAPGWRMTLSEAKQFGALYGTCLRCGRDLTLEESIERAMGSTCAKKANWA